MIFFTVKNPRDVKVFFNKSQIENPDYYLLKKLKKIGHCAY